jgi:hypothetical protein
MANHLIVCKSNISSISFNHIASDYNNLAQSKQDFWIKFMNVARYEDLTFRLIMNIIGPADWIKKAQYERDVPLESAFVEIEALPLLEQVQQNYLLHSFFGDICSIEQIIILLEPFRQYFLNKYIIYTDIYGQDIYNLCYPHHRTAHVYFHDNAYMGHIYRMGSTSAERASFIGIRESLTNTFQKLYHNKGLRGIGYILLSGIQRTTLLTSPSITTLELASPIGPMPYIAEKFGFTYGETMNIHDQPKVSTYMYTISIL